VITFYEDCKDTDAMPTDSRTRVLILEDDPSRQNTFLNAYPGAIIVDSAVTAIERLGEEWDLIFLDHDLGRGSMPDSGREDCGYEVVRHILEHQPQHLRGARFIVHSANPIRSRIMAEDLQRAGYATEHKPFINLLIELK
jgi:CheY-like chemotaxis protein